MNLFQVLVDEVHVVLVEHNVDEAEELNFFISVHEFRILLVYVPLELGVEI